MALYGHGRARKRPAIPLPFPTLALDTLTDLGLNGSFPVDPEKDSVTHYPTISLFTVSLLSSLAINRRPVRLRLQCCEANHLLVGIFPIGTGKSYAVVTAESTQKPRVSGADARVSEGRKKSKDGSRPSSGSCDFCLRFAVALSLSLCVDSASESL